MRNGRFICRIRNCMKLGILDSLVLGTRSKKLLGSQGPFFCQPQVGKLKGPKPVAGTNRLGSSPDDRKNLA